MRVTFVVQGGRVDVDVDPSKTVGECIRLALERPGIGGAPGEWKARTEDGRILDSGKSMIEEGVGMRTKLYLGAGRGGGGHAADAEHAKMAGADTGAGEIAEMATGVERRNVEFKDGTAWVNLRCVLTRTIMAMANLKGGGKIVIGVKEGPGKTAVSAGMSREDFDSYNHDDIASFVNEYAEPPVVVVPRKIIDNGNLYVVLDVEEFSEVPIVCKKDGRKACSGHLRRGSVYHRSKRKVESTDRFDYGDMRELVGLVATKQHKWMHQQCAELYGMAREAPAHAPGGGDALDECNEEGRGF